MAASLSKYDEAVALCGLTHYLHQYIVDNFM